MTDAPPSEKWTETRLFSLLAKRYAPPAYALLRQVHNATGLKMTRSADAVAMSLYPSAGLDLHGFEIKVSRSDFLNELKDVSKHAAVARYCHRWWLVVPDKGMVRLDEVPEPWGILYAHATPLRMTQAATYDLRILRQAAKLDPAPMEPVFLAAILRRALDVVPQSVIVDDSSRMEARLAAAEREYERRLARETSSLKEEAENLRTAVDQFEAASGIAIREYHGARMGEAFKVAQVLVSNVPEIRRSVSGCWRQVQALVTSLDEIDASQKVSECQTSP